MLGRLDEAEEALKRAIGSKPEYAEAHSNLGNVVREQGRLDDAIACFRQAIALKPGANAIWSNLLYVMHYHPDYDCRRIYQEHRVWAQGVERSVVGEIRELGNDRDENRRLKIGYVSADFRAHAAANFLLPLFRNHNSENVEVICYSGVRRGDAMTDGAEEDEPGVARRFCIVGRGVGGADTQGWDRRSGGSFGAYGRKSPGGVCAEAGAGAGDLAGLSEYDGAGDD